jgi:YgiT-type zinc finger domain-containing protein
MTMNKRTVVCDVCGLKGARIRHVARSYGHRATLFVIENVPLITCPHCGESYLMASTLHDLERIKIHRRSFAKRRSVPVATFG